MITVKNLEKNFGENNEIHVLKGIDENIRKGEQVVVIGPSGSGKSTFLRCLNLLENPTEGQIFFNGEEITSPKCDINKVRQNIGMVFQHFNLFPHLTIKQNITLAPIKLGKMTKEEADKRAMELLHRVGLSDKADAYPQQLSGGQKQRISLARALAVKPSILILDDTTSAVDLETEKRIQDALANLDYPCTKIIVAQRISSAKDADRIIILKDGGIAEMGTHEELIKTGGYYSEVYELQK